MLDISDVVVLRSGGTTEEEVVFEDEFGYVILLAKVFVVSGYDRLVEFEFNND